LAVAAIGVAPFASAAPDIEWVDPARVAGWLPPRRADAHKGVFGRALIAGGSLRYTGAVALSAAAAARTGAGRVTVALPLPLHAALAGQLLEITWLPLAGPEGVHTAAGGAALLAAAGECQALLVGPGLTTVESAQAFIATLFPEDGVGGLPHSPWAGRVVVDADALNILAGWAAWPRRLPPGSILTPHAGEMARLTGQSAQAVNAARIATARRCAETWGHIVLLKGPHTVIAAPDGRVGVLPFATSTLATAGSGDILAGAIVAFIAQGVPAFEAAIAGAYLHGQVGLNLLREEAIAPTAVDILAGMGKALTQMYQSVG
jgi:NAD(P)H-hydrate epimerase